MAVHQACPYLIRAFSQWNIPPYEVVRIKLTVQSSIEGTYLHQGFNWLLRVRYKIAVKSEQITGLQRQIEAACQEHLLDSSFSKYCDNGTATICEIPAQMSHPLNRCPEEQEPDGRTLTLILPLYELSCPCRLRQSILCPQQGAPR